jgi:ABC-type glycerol-3-phosphate transport system substrate-binding protein
MRFTKKLLAAAAVSSMALGLAAASGGPALAYVVCNGAGDCWHTDQRYHYGAAAGAVVHPDSWYFHQHWDANHHWMDHHEGRGYYRNGAWITF